MAIDTSRMDLREKRRLIDAIAHAIEQASIHCPPRSGWTKPMTRECFHKCLGIYEVLRNEVHFSPQRACDELPSALRCYLEKVPWEPKMTASWVVSDNITSDGIILPS